MIRHWIALSRFPFYASAYLPFIAGSLLAARITGVFDWRVFLTALCAITCILISTHFNSEVYDVAEDTFAQKYRYNTPFSGGSAIMVQKLLPAPQVLMVSKIAALLALLMGCILQYGFKTGPLTLFLGISGLIAGYYYSKPPVRLIKRGLGEISIAYAYGFLPVITGWYIQGNTISPLACLVSIPIAGSIFNVILINEFPDYEADIAAGKYNLLTRLGKEAAIRLYATIVCLSVFSVYMSIIAGAPRAIGMWYLPAALLSVAILAALFTKKHSNRAWLTCLCGATILANIGTATAYIISYALQPRAPAKILFSSIIS